MDVNSRLGRARQVAALAGGPMGHHLAGVVIRRPARTKGDGGLLARGNRFLSPYFLLSDFALRVG